MAELFGFELKRKDKELPSFIPKQEDDGAIVVEGAGVYGTFLDVDGSLKTEAELVSKYREIAEYGNHDFEWKKDFCDWRGPLWTNGQVVCHASDAFRSHCVCCR